MTLKLRIGALEYDSHTADLEYILPKGVEEEGAIQFGIKAAILSEAGSFLRAGYNANADIVLYQRDSVMAVKEKDLLFEDEKFSLISKLAIRISLKERWKRDLPAESILKYFPVWKKFPSKNTIKKGLQGL